MKKRNVFLIFMLMEISISYSQQDSCIKGYYSGKNNILNAYSIYTIDKNISLDSLTITGTELHKIIESFKKDEIVNSINLITKDTLFMKFHKMFMKSETNDGYEYKDFVTFNSPQSDNYFTNINILNKEFKPLLENLKLLNLSIFFYTPKYDGDEFYFYEVGQRFSGIFEFKTKPINNPFLYSPLNTWTKKINLLKYSDNVIGFAKNKYTQIVIIPIVKNGKYICDLKLLFCNKK